MTRRRYPKWQYPRIPERRYLATLREIIGDIEKMTKESLIRSLRSLLDDAARFDDWPTDLASIIERQTVIR